MDSGEPNKKKFSKILEILFLFQSFLKASLCKLIHINLFGVFSWKFAVDGPYVLHGLSSLPYGLLFVGGPTVEHGPYVIHTVRHPRLRTVIYDWRSVCGGTNSQYKYVYAWLSSARTKIHESRSRPLLARYYMQKETKPLSHVITAAFGSVLYSERNETV